MRVVPATRRWLSGEWCGSRALRWRGRTDSCNPGDSLGGLDRNRKLGFAANGGNPERGLREREIVQVACEGSASRPLAGKAEARQSGQRRALRHALEQGREGCFSLPLYAHVGPEVTQAALGENAITCPAHDNRSIAAGCGRCLRLHEPAAGGIWDRPCSGHRYCARKCR